MSDIIKDQVDELQRLAQLWNPLEQALMKCADSGIPWWEIESFAQAMVGLAGPTGPHAMERAAELNAMSYPEYLRSPEWQTHRRHALLRAKARCQACNDKVHLEVHHRTYENKPWELPEDLIVLCAACHTAVHLVVDGRRGKVRAESRRAK